MDTALYWIGAATTAILSIVVVGWAALWLFFTVAYRRFNTIFFRKSQRRLSIASWHQTTLLRTCDPDEKSIRDDWPADDWPVNERPFYLSYRIGARRFFLLAGYLPDGPRHSSIKGTHP